MLEHYKPDDLSLLTQTATACFGLAERDLSDKSTH